MDLGVCIPALRFRALDKYSSKQISSIIKKSYSSAVAGVVLCVLRTALRAWFLDGLGGGLA